MRLSGKVALVTGSGRGIGRAIALRLAEEGADVVVNFFRHRQPAEATAALIHDMGRKAIVVKANLERTEEAVDLVQAAHSQFGGIDLLIHNAALGYNRPALEQRPKGWDWSMNVNARSFLFLAQAAAPLMAERGGGAMVALSSPGSQRVIPEYIVVGASKAALESLVRYLAVELAHLGIAVNGVSPGVVETEALQHFELGAEPGLLDQIRRATPAGRLPTADDVAAIVSFLCSPEATMIRGQVLLVDGGYTLPADLAIQ